MLWDEKQLPSNVSDIHQLEAVAANYRKLVLCHDRNRDFESSEDFHIGEMEVRRLAAATRFPRKLRRIGKHLNSYAIYRYLSAYGSSYWQALAVIVMMVLIFPGLFMFTGLQSVPTRIEEPSHSIQYHIPPREDENRPALKQISTDYLHSITHTLEILTFQRERRYRPANMFAQAFESFTTIILAGQVALLLLAIRRRFKR